MNIKTIIFTGVACLLTATAYAQTNNENGNMKKVEVKQTAGRTVLGEFAPEFAHLNDDVLFGEVWNRNDKLSLHDRSMATVTALVSQGIIDSSLKAHLQNAKTNGVTKTEISELITHIAFYAGWPKAWGAFRMAMEVWNGDTKATPMSREAYQQQIMFPIGEPNTAYAKYFIGQSYLAPVSSEQIGIANVTFEPGCRNNWHIHHATKGGGQILICVGGEGWYQEWGKPARKLLPGDVVNIPANVKHWHGAAADSWFSHLAMSPDGENVSNEWLEPVTDEEYKKLGK